MYTTLISVEQLKALRDAKARLMVFDCTFDLMDPASGEKQYLQSHIPGAVYAHLDDALSDKGQPDAERRTAAACRRRLRWPPPAAQPREVRDVAVAAWASPTTCRPSCTTATAPTTAAGCGGCSSGPAMRRRRCSMAACRPGRPAGGEVRAGAEASHFQSNFELRRAAAPAGRPPRGGSSALGAAGQTLVDARAPHALSRRGRAAGPGGRPHPRRAEPALRAEHRRRRPLQAGARSCARNSRQLLAGRDPAAWCTTAAAA